MDNKRTSDIQGYLENNFSTEHIQLRTKPQQCAKYWVDKLQAVCFNIKIRKAIIMHCIRYNVVITNCSFETLLQTKVLEELV